jgi:ribosome-associated protein
VRSRTGAGAPNRTRAPRAAPRGRAVYWRPTVIELPEDDDDLLAECDVTTFRAGGPGGQHQNTTDSAVRLHHRPSGIVVVCRAERSQYRNKATCLARLRDKAARANADEARPTRRAGKVSRAERERRLADKARRARRKQERAAPAVDDA